MQCTHEVGSCIIGMMAAVGLETLQPGVAVPGPGHRCLGFGQFFMSLAMGLTTTNSKSFIKLHSSTFFHPGTERMSPNGRR